MKSITRLVVLTLTLFAFFALPVMGQSDDGPPAESEPGAPECPTSLAGYPPQTGGIFMSWTHHSFTDAKVYRDDGDGEFKLLDRLEFPTNRYIDHSAEPGQTYSYQVTAIDDNGTESRACETETLTAVPECPVDLEAHPRQNGANELTWTLRNETDVKVYRAHGDGDFEFVARLESPATSYVDNDTEAGETYTYRVNSITDNGIEKLLCGTAEVTTIPYFPTWLSLLSASAIAVAGYAAFRRRR